MIRSSKSNAFASRNRRWYSVYASASTFSAYVLALAAQSSGSTSSFFRLLTWPTSDLAG